MSEIERTIRQYVQRSAGNCNHISDHTMRCFVGMLEIGEATIADFRRVSPKLADRVAEFANRLAQGVLF